MEMKCISLAQSRPVVLSTALGSFPIKKTVIRITCMSPIEVYNDKDVNACAFRQRCKMQILGKNSTVCISQDGLVIQAWQVSSLQHGGI